MEGVVLRGMARRYANLKGLHFRAEKPGRRRFTILKGPFTRITYNASFLGFAPVSNPQIVIVVTLQGTSGGEAGFGGPVAAPVFSEVAMAALRMLDVPKDSAGFAGAARRSGVSQEVHYGSRDRRITTTLRSRDWVSPRPRN